MEVGNRDFSRPLLKALNILPFYSQYLFVVENVENMDKFVTSSDIHGIHTRQGLSNL
jgi:hypothetical protein